MEEGTEPQEQELDEQLQEATEAQEELHAEPEEEQEQTNVPVSAIVKERRKRQEAEAAAQRALVELQYLKEQMSSQKSEPEEEDESLYESVTKKELNDSKSSISSSVKREFREEMWAENNPEKAQWVDANLKEFLQQRPNYASAISESKNRYLEAWNLMNAFQPKQSVQPKPRKQGIQNPADVPKAPVASEAIDVMKMSDAEFREWRASKRRGR